MPCRGGQGRAFTRAASGLLVLTAPWAAPLCAQSNGNSWRWARVTYVSGTSVYVDAGTTHGVRERTRVEFVRADSVWAVLDVQYVSSTRASGTLSRGGPLVLGDSGRFRPVADQALASPEVASASAPDAARVSTTPSNTPPKRRSGRPLSARLGIRYLDLQTGGGPAGHVTQPAVDARVESHRFNGSPFGLVVDARAHRQRSGSGRTDGSTRVYQSLLEWQSAGSRPTRVAVGRQLATTLSSLGYFDGVSIDRDHAQWRVGLLAGTQPDAASFRPDGSIKEAGGWVQWHNAPGTPGLLQITLGGIGSYATGGVNREYAVLNALLVRPRVSVFATQEMDVNRAWRRDAENGRPLTWSSTFTTVRVEATRALSINGGYDSRRMVRLYRDFLTPDVAFDDAFRRGYFGGASLSLPHFFASVDSRVSDGLSVGKNTSHTASLAVTRLTPLGIGVRLRSTQYDGPTVSGALHSGSVEVSPRGLLHVALSAGARRDLRIASTLDAIANTRWIGIDADAGIGRSWYVMYSHYRETGNVDQVLQQYLGLSWRY